MTLHPAPLLIRADASKTIGTGHVMRMLALAQAWISRGGEVHLATHQLPDALQLRLESECVRLHPIANDDPGSADDAMQSIALAQSIGASWLVADGYRFGSVFQDLLSKSDLRLAVVTDFDYCDHWNSDLVINQNPHAVEERYQARSDCRRLLGTRFALLRNEFLDEMVEAMPEFEASHAASSSNATKILITLGGSDKENLTGRVLKALDNVTLSDQAMEVRVLIGTANPNREELERVAAGLDDQIELMESVSDMAEQYRWADGLIGAGGSSCWEWMHAGLNAAILVLADNQQPIYDHLTEHRIATGLGRSDQWDDEFVQTQLRTFLSGVRRDSEDRTRFRSIIDGHGAQRIAAAMDSGIWLRPATSTDCKRYFDWANDPTVRAQSLTTDPIPWESHVDWFDRQLASRETHMWVAIRDEKPVGQIRFCLDDMGNWVVSFSVATEARGSGVGKHLLALGTARMRRDYDDPLLATVRCENIASANCFRRQGWDPIDPPEKDLLLFRKTG